MLELKKVNLIKGKRGKKNTLLNNISLEIPKGRITLLLGKSGSGKTSLLRCLSQLEREYLGDIFCEFQELKSISSKERVNILGFVPQDFGLFPHLSVLDNCAKPLALKIGKKAAYDEAKSMLDRLGIGAYFERFPHELSGGQKQRVALCRSLVFRPSFILLDEPTSALDPENAEIILQILMELKREGKGVVISSQDLSFASKVLDIVVLIEDGAIVERYDSSESLDLSPRLHQFLSTPFFYTDDR